MRFEATRSAKCTYLVRTHLLEGVYVLDSQFIAVKLGLESLQCFLEVYLCPFLDLRHATVGLGAISSIRTCLVRGKRVVEAILLNGDTLLVLALEWITKESKGKIERRSKHAVLRFGAKHGECSGFCEVLEKEAVLHTHGYTKINYMLISTSVASIKGKKTHKAAVGQKELGSPLQACRSLKAFRNPGRDEVDWKPELTNR